MTVAVGVVAGSSQFTETQLRLPGGAVTNSVLSTPDNAAFPTGDFDVSWFGSIDDPTINDVGLIGQWAPNADRAWSLRWANVAGVGQFRVWLSSNGTTSTGSPDGTYPFTLAAGQFFGVRATRRMSDGPVQVYTTPGDAGAWTFRGQVVLLAGVPVFNSAAPVTIGGIPTATAGVTSNHVVGWWRHSELRNVFNSVGAGLVASPDVRAVPDQVSSFTDAQARLWTLNGATDLITRPLAA